MLGILVAGLVLQAASSVDAPDVETARRSAQQALGPDTPGRTVLNATTTTTPEILHVPTGARCRFWYASVAVDSPWLDDRALACITRHQWLTVSYSFYNLNGPRRPGQSWRGTEYLGIARTLPDLARARAGRLGGTVTAVSPIQGITTADGSRYEYVSLTNEYEGGAPNGFRNRRMTTWRLMLAGDWLIELSAEGPVHYQASLREYADTSLQRVSVSMDESRRSGPPDATHGSPTASAPSHD